MNEQDILALLRSGSEAGYEAMFRQYWNYVYTIVFQMLRDCGSREDVEDCVIEVLSAVMLRYDPAHGVSLKAYIGTAAKHMAIDARRRLTKLPVVSMDDGMAELPDSARVEEDAENAEITRILLEQITALGQPDSAILLQKYFYDRNCVEIARILKMNPVTVRSRCHRAIKRLRTALSELGLDKEGLL